MPNLHAAIGISQLLKLPQIKKKEEIYSIYYERLNKYKEIKQESLMKKLSHSFVIRLLNFKRQDFNFP